MTLQLPKMSRSERLHTLLDASDGTLNRIRNLWTERRERNQFERKMDFPGVENRFGGDLFEAIYDFHYN